MGSDDVTIEILKSIRDEIRELRVGQAELRGEVRVTNERLDMVRTELGDRIERLERRNTETEVRLSTSLSDVVGALEDVKTLLRENYASTIRDLDRRVAPLESRVGS